MFEVLKDFFINLKGGRGRKHERIRLQGLLTVAPMRSRYDEKQYKRAAIADISSSGMAIEGFASFNVGDEIMLMFSLPGHEISIAGIVMRSHQEISTSIYGIKFDLALTDKESIKQVIKYAKSEMKKLESA